MDTFFVLTAAAITLMALRIGEHQRRSPEPRPVPMPATPRTRTEHGNVAGLGAASRSYDS
jgi:hypothetical protein